MQLIKELTLGSQCIRLVLNDETPLAEWKGNAYNHIWLLVQEIPNLSNATFLKEFSLISNFLWKGLQFQLIDEITHYQKFYKEQVELEKKSPHAQYPYRLTNYKIFDVSVMHEPRIEKGQLYYFVFQTNTRLPYRVICPFPYEISSSIVHYQILPLIHEEIGKKQ